LHCARVCAENKMLFALRESQEVRGEVKRWILLPRESNFSSLLFWRIIYPYLQCVFAERVPSLLLSYDENDGCKLYMRRSRRLFILRRLFSEESLDFLENNICCQTSTALKCFPTSTKAIILFHKKIPLLLHNFSSENGLY
jgi:hypothetical protein